MGIKSIRESRGVTQNALAVAMGVSINTVWRWENGERSPSLSNAQRIANYFNCTIEELTENPPQPLTGKKASRTGAQKGASVGV